ncbi:MAG: hypothetical protein KC636_39255, partial [Myxococcales bacterium]|nr:hypothetical protein [Myxococcales bacterium]
KATGEVDGGAWRRRRRLIALGAVALALGVAAALVYGQRGRLVCRDAACDDCLACCTEAGFGVAGCGSDDPCACFQQVTLVDERGEIHLENPR